MTERAKDELDQFIEAATAVLWLDIDPAWVPAIRANLEVTLAHARNVEALPLADEAEPASVFEA